MLILQGIVGLSQDERSSQESHQRSLGMPAGSRVWALIYFPENRGYMMAGAGSLGHVASPSKWASRWVTLKQRESKSIDFLCKNTCTVPPQSSGERMLSAGR